MPSHVVFQLADQLVLLADNEVMDIAVVGQQMDMEETTNSLGMDSRVVVEVALAPKLVPNDWLALVLVEPNPNDLDLDLLVQCHRRMRWCNWVMVHD